MSSKFEDSVGVVHAYADFAYQMGELFLLLRELAVAESSIPEDYDLNDDLGETEQMRLWLTSEIAILTEKIQQRTSQGHAVPFDIKKAYEEAVENLAKLPAEGEILLNLAHLRSKKISDLKKQIWDLEH